MTENASCMLTTLLVWDFKNFKYLVVVVQSVHYVVTGAQDTI